MDGSLAARLLGDVLPAQVLEMLRLLAEPMWARAQPVLAAARLLGGTAVRLVAGAQGAGGLAAAVAVVLLTLVVLDWLRRLVLWWTRLVVRLVFWAAVAALVAWVWQRGVAESARDAALVAGRLVGYLAALRDVWVREYDRYEGQQKAGYGRAARGRSYGR